MMGAVVLPGFLHHDAKREQLVSTSTFSSETAPAFVEL